MQALTIPLTLLVALVLCQKAFSARAAVAWDHRTELTYEAREAIAEAIGSECPEEKLVSEISTNYRSVIRHGDTSGSEVYTSTFRSRNGFDFTVVTVVKRSVGESSVRVASVGCAP
jgi:hypothetical protein